MDDNEKVRNRINAALNDAVLAGELKVDGATVMINNFLCIVDVIIDDRVSEETRNPIVLFASSDTLAMNLGLHQIAGLMLQSAAIGGMSGNG